MRTPAFVAVAAGALVLLGLVWTGTWNRRDKIADDPRTVTVSRGSLEVTAAATGTFQPLEYVDVGAQLSGQLKAVSVGLGEAVRRGQLVAAIDDTTAKARLAQSEAAFAGVRAQVAAKQAQIDLARVQRDRNARLVERGFISVATQDVAETSLESLRAEADSLNAQAASLTAVIEQAKTELKFAEVRAPMDGVVIALVARPGQTLNATQQAPVILRVANLDSLVLVAQVSEADIVHLRPDVVARFNLLGLPDRSFAARVRQVLPAPNVINSVVFYDVLVDLPQPPERLFRIGMTAQVYFVIARHECMLKIPRVALPADLRPPQTVRLDLVGADRLSRAAEVRIAAADEAEGGIPCVEAARAGIEVGAKVVIAVTPRRKEGPL